MSEPGDDTRQEPLEGSSGPTSSTAAEPEGGRKRRRRRGRGGRNRNPEPASTAPDDSTLQSLTAGLFSHVDEREVPCKVEGCDRTWAWSAEEQIRAFGQPPPKRMCPEHVAQFHALADREIACMGRECSVTWLWTKSAQVSQLQKTGSDEPPQRLCDGCKKAERELGDIDVPCRIDGCTGSWRWSRDAQLKHRAWLRRADDGSQVSSRREPQRRRRRRRSSTEGPPPRLCERCRNKLSELIERDVQCKVHGCTRMVAVDRESQLRAWVSLRTDEPSEQAPLPKRMCEVCREFCRLHVDRQVPCGRPGCDRTWTYKTGAQLQAFLAGRLEDPIRLCDACREGEFAREAEVALEAPQGAEVMPCIVSGCSGVWFHHPGMTIAAADDGDLPLDRMCDACRERREALPRNTPPAVREETLDLAEDGSVGEGVADDVPASDEAVDPAAHPEAGDPL